ncbi:BgTH12-00545 [Blumeria graminis f. sp. triticale]|uniref:Large ribosomal subunit protein bL28m n=3 Tax=Blumeria graminis TaxID=34373 RepID=A0A061HEM3_BLUGR|nr:Mitochondrial ribosomal [Blumeria graminis f. sp. tritici 96224]CAD6505046.1 BgTH12-00545 [Blumeria graminis f. sp. triticale]VDB93051.1 Bgt-2462 [Blumeria graminis f. sp. tritici]
MSLIARFNPINVQCRGFSGTANALAKSTKQRLKFEHSAVPPYPYGPSQIYKQSNFGLYGTQKIRFGNMVSERNEIKTRRHWRPNVHQKELYSASLEKNIKIRITTRVLRTVRKVGGLDEYLLGEKAARIKELGMGGWKLRWRIMQTPTVRDRYNKQRKELGLPLVGLPPGATDELPENGQVIAEEIKTIDEQLVQGTTINMGQEEDLCEPEHPTATPSPL